MITDWSDRLKNRSSGKGTALFILVFAAYAVSYLGRNTFAAAIKAMSAAGASHVPPQAITPGAERYSDRFSCVTPPVGINRTPVCLYGP